ncbi:Alpha-l-rhamnosidase [Fusarium keratoplasticum]|nr:Alpha-l-rhamnosidase [Fusarium keratoplasticum]
MSATTHLLAPELAGYLRPKRVHAAIGNVHNEDALLSGVRDFQAPASQVCTLTSGTDDRASVVLDYDVVVCGVPVFFVHSVSPAAGETEVVLEATYSEALAYIDREDGDGPFPFTAGADTLRANRYRIDRPGMIEHFQLQGGQRWQRLELVTPGSIRLTLVGFKPTTYNQEPADMTGYFECSDSQLNQIWATGARTVQINSIPAKSTVANWQVLSSGTLISSQRASHYTWGGNWTDYAVQVETNIIDGGFALAIRSRGGFGPLFQFYLDGANLKIDFLYGFYNQAQITLWQTFCGSCEHNVKALGLAEGIWKRWEITAYGDEEYVILLEGEVLTSFKQLQGERRDANGRVKSIAPHEGSFGFGTGKGQTAMFRNCRAVSRNGDLLYSSTMRDPHVLSDFAVGTNHLPCMLDGGKRDRAVWLGDTVVPALALYYSTGMFDFVLGSIEACLSRQREDGTIPAFALVGISGLDASPEHEVTPPYHILAGTFTMYVVRLCSDYLLYTGNVGYIRSIYPRLQKLISVIADKVDERGLVTLEGLWAMDSDYYNKSRSGSTTKNNAVYVIALQRMTLVAEALDDLASAEDYRKRAERVRAAVNERLFNKTTELYDASENNRDIVSEDANAFALLADFPSSIGQRKTILRRLHALKSPGGYLSFDKESGYMETPVVSPIMNGWHAEAALQVGDLDNFNDAIDIWRSVPNEAWMVEI